MSIDYRPGFTDVRRQFQRFSFQLVPAYVEGLKFEGQLEADIRRAVRIAAQAIET